MRILRTVLATAVAGVSGLASAQTPDLNALALEWIRGRYASPVICRSDGVVNRTIQRVVVSPGPKHRIPPVDRVAFLGIEIESASRCSDDLGRPLPDVRGSLELTLPGFSRPDLAQTDFKRALREPGGFVFDVKSGRLRVSDWGSDEPPRVVDFRGGTARILRVRPGSDRARLLSEFGGPQKLSVELSAPDGEALSFLLALYDAR